MKTDMWNPGQYEKFKQERAQPFLDLLALVKGAKILTAVDLGCGTGELTGLISKRFAQAQVLGIDYSDSMLEKSKIFKNQQTHFQKRDVENFFPNEKWDLVFSNAALQWLPDHEALLPRVLSWVGETGQIAIQMPCNFDHPSHRIAYEVAGEFDSLNGKIPAIRAPLSVEKYADIFYQNGFQEQNCRVQVYMHPMKSGSDVIEWTKGTLLTSFQKLIEKDEFEKFVHMNREKLLAEIGDGPYVYAFKRLLLWGQRS